jgi:RNA polymerase sigma-70 factor (ECF subfamily)
MATAPFRLQGERATFYELVWPQMASVLRTAQFLTHNTAEAEDLTQETMLKAFRSLDTLDDPQRVRPWLMTILRRLRVDVFRHDRGHRHDVSLSGALHDPADAEHDEVLDVHDLGADPDRAIDEFSDQQLIRALKTLPKPIRWALLLVDVEGFEMIEAAKVLDVPTGTVKSRLHRGRAMLRAALVESGATAETRIGGLLTCG